MDQYLWVSLSRYFVEVRREPDHVAGEPNLWLTFRRIYGDRASLFRAILACISHPNKLPLMRIAKGLILLQCAHVSTPSPSGRRLLSNSACQLFMLWEWRKSEGSFSTCCEINRFEKG